MPRAQTNGIELEYEVIGTGEPIVLIMGIGAQMIAWHDEFRHMLADQGFQVIHFDNRDAGLSTKMDGPRLPRVNKMLAKAMLGMSVEAPYTLMDMADDVAGLLDHLNLADAHIVGASMGGMVAQTMAIVQPTRVRSLTSIMSHPGNRRSSVSKPSALKALLGKVPRTREEAIERYLVFQQVCGSKGFEIDVDYCRDLAGRGYDRSFCPSGFVRQMAAIIATGDRTKALRFVRAPTLVLHGSDDPLIRPAGGRATARAIRGAQFQMIQGMGHDMPRGAWPIISGAIANHGQSVDKRRKQATPASTQPATATA